ncbi:MAG: hypothetical protein ABI227_01665 [Rhodanobacter sp.]
MIRIAMLLLGLDFMRRRWLTLAIIGGVVALLGVAIGVDALDGVLYFPLHLFGYVLIAEGLITAAVASTPLAYGRGLRYRALRYFKSALFVLIGVLVINHHHAGVVVLALLFGILFLVGGALRIAAAHVVRFPGWRGSMLAGAAELVLAVVILEPWPTHYAGTVPYCIGVGLLMSGFGAVRVAWRIHRLPAGSSLLALPGSADAPPDPVSDPASPLPHEPLIVHVWTPVGSADHAVRRPIVDRYIAAVDAKGVISTGHVSMELAPDTYISHYPAVEMDRSPDDFSHTLKAIEKNNVPGLFQPNYPHEVANWCESTEKVAFTRYSPARLRAFWDRYRTDNTYNLTYRNCSSTVVDALEASLEGVLARAGRGWGAFSTVLISPELWVASQLHRRARTMAWTPGLALDYARALHGLVHPAPLGWLTLLRLTRRRADHDRRRRKQAAAGDAAAAKAHTAPAATTDEELHS